MARPARSQADIRLAAAAERRVHGAALGYHPRRMKPVHLASSFILALTARWRELEWLNKAAIPKSAPKPRSRVVDEYVSDNLLPRLRELDMISEAVDLEAFRRLRSHLNAAFNNDGAALGAVYRPYTTFGSDFSAPSSEYVSNYSKNHGHTGPFLIRIFGASPQGESVLQKARELLAGPKPPLAVLGMPLVDQTDAPWADDYDSQFGAMEPARLHAIATLMEPQTCALLRLLENMQSRQSAYALRYFVIGLSAWLFVYMMKRSNDVPLLLLDALQGTNPRIRAQSRASYARQLDLFSGSYEHMRDSGAAAIDDSDWEAFVSADDAYQMLDDHFRDLGVRAGLIQPRAPNAKRKHVELQADTLRTMVLSLLAPGPPRTLAELSAGLRDVWCICTGGDASDGERLQAAGDGPLDRDEDLEPNAAAFRDLLIRLGLAVEPSDGLTLCAIDAEELL